MDILTPLLDMKEELKEMFLKEIENNITDESIKKFGTELMCVVPEYFWKIPAGSTGKYHPASELGEGGLVRHSIKVMKILGYLLVIDSGNLTDREQELLILAALFHDCCKSGKTDKDYDQNNHTRFLHPLYAHNLIMECGIKCEFPYCDTKFICDAVISHMGQWNKSSKEEGILPLPETPAQKLLHMADYLASRKDIEIDIN